MARRSRARRSPARPSASPGKSDIADAARRLGIAALYPEQERVIAEALAGRDALMILPTGFGKSACYQVPSMVLPKPVVLVSPLLALLRDQHENLIRRKVPCVRLDGTVRGRARREAMERIAEGGPLLVMTTPETLMGAELPKALEKTGVGLAAIDEAHCISEWGHDFRPAYLRLGAQIRALGAPPIMALTATATPRVRSAIVRSLGMREPSIVASSPHRSNLAFEVLRCEGDARPRALVRLVRRLRRPGIIYCATRREVDEVYTILGRFGIPVHRYHGRMTAAERNIQQTRYMRRGNRSVMVATSAFGLGIDKPDIRYILHYQSPASLEQYVQEAGRGGRDGRKSNCILLYDPADRAIHQALLARSRVRPEQLYRLGKALEAWAAGGQSPSIEALALSAELGTRVTSALLAKVEEAGLVTRVDSEVTVTGASDSIEQDTRGLAGQFETLRTRDGHRLDAIERYTDTDTCRAVFLQHYFGEEAESSCGLCDICTGGRRRSPGFFAPLTAPKRPKHSKRPQRRSRRGRRRGRRSRRS